MHFLQKCLFRLGCESVLDIFHGNVRSLSMKAKTVNSKHVQKGHVLPPFAGTLRLYGMRFSPFGQRVVLMLNAKKIDYEVFNVDLVKRPDWVYQKHPKGKIPSIEIQEGVTIHDSIVIADYLEDAYPEIKLKSENPLVRAYDNMVINHSNLISKFFIKSVRFTKSVEPNEIKMFYAYLDYIQSELTRRGTRYLHGDKPGYVDYVIWPWFERFPAMKNDGLQFWPLPEKYGRLVQYISDMRQDPYIIEYMVPEHIMRMFIQQFGESYPKYDILDAELEKYFEKV